MYKRMFDTSPEKHQDHLRKTLFLTLDFAVQERNFARALNSLYLYNYCFPDERIDEERLAITLSIEPAFLTSSIGARKRLLWPHIHLLSMSFNGRDEGALRDRIDILRHFSRIAPPSYDAAWTILEAWEQLGARVSPGSRVGKLFVESYVDLCLKTPNTFLKGTMTWGLNEFFERGKQVRTGQEIARRLIRAIKKKPDTTILRVLHVLNRLKDEMREVTEKKKFQLPPEDRETVALGKLADGAIQRFDRESRSKKAVRRLASFPEVKELIGCWHTTRSSQGIGIMAMGQFKRVLGHVAYHLRRDYELIRDLCVPILRKVDADPKFPSFLAIESLEAVRGAAPDHCARVMAEYLRHVRSEALAFGIDVCMAEHYEERGERAQPARWRFSRESGRWKAIVKYPKLKANKLDCFFLLAERALNARLDLSGLAYWINRRLDQHPAIVAGNRG